MHEPDEQKRQQFMDYYLAEILEGYRTETTISDDMVAKLPLFVKATQIELIVDAFEVEKSTGENYLDEEDIEEIISDVFVMLWQNAEYIDLEKGTIRSYIFVSARNFALKRLNKKSEYTSIDEIDLPDITNCADDCSETEELWKSVMELGEPDNEIFVRFYKFDEKLKDISLATGLNISTIKSKLSRGKRKLKKIILNAEETL